MVWVASSVCQVRRWAAVRPEVRFLPQFDWARRRLADRMAGPSGDSGNGVLIEIPAMTDDEYLWEPVPGCWSIRPRTAGPGLGRDRARRRG
jgi:hypothetical protein